MKKVFIAITLFVLGVTTAACAGQTFAKGSWRYKMTVTVETPEGIKSGSAVREVTVQKGISLTPEMLPHVDLKGEAVVVDLGERGVLFALLKGYRIGTDYGSDIPFYIFPYEGGGLSAEGIRHFSKLKAGPVELKPEWYPMLVYFKDINDPKTIDLAIEMKPCDRNNTVCLEKDNFEEAFGAGVKLKSITLEMTDETVSFDDISQYLRWFMQPGYSLGLKFFNPNISNPAKYVTTNDFKTGKQ